MWQRKIVFAKLTEKKGDNIRTSKLVCDLNGYLYSSVIEKLTNKKLEK